MKLVDDVKLEAALKSTADAIRSKSGSEDELTFDEESGFSSAVGNIPQTSLNIAYSETAPSDTSKIWVKSGFEPESYEINSYTSSVDPVSSITTLSTILPKGFQGGNACSVGQDIYVQASQEKKLMKFNAISETCTLFDMTLEDVASAAASNGEYIYFFGLSKTIKYDINQNVFTTINVRLSINDIKAECVNGNIYIFGGDSGTTYYSSIYKFNTETEALVTQSVKLPQPVYQYSTAVVGTDIYIIGGRTGTGYNTWPVNTIYKYNTLTDTVSTMTSVLPTSLSGSYSKSVGTDIYIFGGNTGSLSNKVYKYDTLTDTIKEMNISLPSASTAGAAGVWNGTIYLFGGYAGSTSSAILKFSPNIPLESNKAYIIAYNSTKQLNGYLINEDTMKFGVNSLDVFIGDENGVGQKKQAYYHNGTEWAEFA